MTTRKHVNPLLPFVLCATSVFSDDVDATVQDIEFQGAVYLLAQLENAIGQAAFEELLANIIRSVSAVAWKQVMEAADAAGKPLTHEGIH